MEEGMVLRGKWGGLRVLHQRQRSKRSLRFELSIMAR